MGATPPLTHLIVYAYPAQHIRCYLNIPPIKKREPQSLAPAFKPRADNSNAWQRTFSSALRGLVTNFS